MELLEKYVSKGKKTASRIIDGEAVVMVLSLEGEDRKFSTLSSTGTLIWKLLGEDRVKIDSIVRKVTEELEIDYEENMAALVGYIKKLVDEQMLDIFDSK